MKKRVLSMILCLLMAVMTIPAALADGEPEGVEETDPAITEIEEPEAAEEPAEEPEAPEEPAEEPEAVEEPEHLPEAPEDPAEETTPDGEATITETVRVSGDGSEQSNDDLFFRYVDEMFRSGNAHPERKSGEQSIIKKAGTGKTGEQLYAVPGLKEKLSEIDYYIELQLKAQVKKIAAGTETSAVVTITFPEDTYNLSDYNINTIIHALLLDCPYDLYWFNKTAITHVNSTYKIGNRTLVKQTWTFPVSTDYRGDSTDTVNPAKVTAAKKAVANANKIVTKYAGKNDCDKLLGYFTEVRALSEYNKDAGKNYVPYGDPWQMIYLFDGDPETKVVCEGYSKGFEYLCNQTTFNSESINAFCADGYAQGSGYKKASGDTWTLEGNHMWNIVRMDDGRNYVVDATNGWFLLYADSGSVANGYYLTVDSDAEYGSLFLPYYMKSSSGDGSTDVITTVPAKYLTLSSSAYQRPSSVPVINVQPSDVDAFKGVSTTLKVSASGRNLTYRWQMRAPGGAWKNCENGSAATYRFTPTLAQDGTTFRCIITNAMGKTVSASATVTVYEAVLSGVQYKGTTPYVVYNGAAQRPGVTLKNAKGSKLAGTVAYRSNVKPGTAYADVTLSGSGKVLTVWFKIYLPATTATTVANTQDGVRITWNSVKDAKGYVIYRRAWSSTTNGWTTFERWNNTTATTWLDTNVYAGTRYQYGVKAYYEDPMNNFDLGLVGPLKTTVRITTRTLESVTAGSRSMTVTWSGSKVFAGYEVQYSTDSTFKTGVKTVRVSNPSTTSTVIKGLSSGTNYCVRVRSYHVFEGTTYYGGWSLARQCKVR